MLNAVVIAGFAVTLPQTAFAANVPNAKLWNSTWHLNSGKSKFSSPDTTTKSDTRTYTVSGARVTMRSTGVNAAGKTMKWHYTAVTNGRWYPVIGNPNADHIALTLVSDHEFSSKTTLHGKPSARSTASVSGDGNELTIHRSILTAKGGPSDDTLIFDRVK